ncbi:hypothetical protein LPJ61_001695 [Coemansia biformis]|uniref:MFS general substrate transporter n=1 Tax=Coemansia biformis TaxID=1286918 RepID=A0A9W8D0D0_9FUNG|nr:hypothetical protein LPJ61_001695 [Coemansia biformis]
MSSRLAEAGQYATLTAALAGLQFAWAVETGFGSPYLLSLGLRKSLVSLVWLAGPLSGLITQPLVGALSDRCASRFGRRRPYIVGSTVCTIACLAVIGWTREIAGGRESLTQWLAIAAFYLLDFAINALQGSLRALIVDALPAARQTAGTAWASRMLGIGSVCGYLMGFLDLGRLLPFLGSTQMQVLTTVASAMLGATVAVTCWFTAETPLARSSAGTGGHLQVFSSPLSLLHSLPRVIKGIFRVQLLAWMGWFPFLFYSTTYVANLFAASRSDGGSSGGSGVMEEGARVGSLAMFVHAVVSLVSSLALPAITYSAAAGRPQLRMRSAVDGSSVYSALRRMLHNILARASVSLQTMWAISLALFSVAMLLTTVVSTVDGASALLAACGVSWAVAVWIPFSMLGEAIRGAGAMRTQQQQQQRQQQHLHGIGDDAEYSRVPTDEIPLGTMGDGYAHGPEHDPHARDGHGELSAGTILGVHNVFCVIPQFFMAVVSSLVFASFEHAQDASAGGAAGHQAQQIALVMALGGLSSAAGAYFAWQL